MLLFLRTFGKVNWRFLIRVLVKYLFRLKIRILIYKFKSKTQYKYRAGLVVSLEFKSLIEMIGQNPVQVKYPVNRGSNKDQKEKQIIA